MRRFDLPPALYNLFESQHLHWVVVLSRLLHLWPNKSDSIGIILGQFLNQLENSLTPCAIFLSQKRTIYTKYDTFVCHNWALSKLEFQTKFFRHFCHEIANFFRPPFLNRFQTVSESHQFLHVFIAYLVVMSYNSKIVSTCRNLLVSCVLLLTSHKCFLCPPYTVGNWGQCLDRQGTA